MKASTFLLCCMVLFTQCKKDNDSATTHSEPDPATFADLCSGGQNSVYEFTDIVPDGTNFEQKYKVTINLPDCYKLTNFIDLDAKHGVFAVPGLDVSLSFGMGQTVGFYGLDASSTKTEEIINGRVLWYEERDNNIYFSFPNAGPASFVSSNVELKDEFLSYLISLTVVMQ